jgi:adenosylmethionine-8-amino-7-oxononanoate aminotransferase
MTAPGSRHDDYPLWNPFTVMDQFVPLRHFGPMTICRGEGAYVFNERGQRFINGMSSLWNVAIGYGREELVEAAAGQMRELAFASTFRQTHPRAIELAARLIEITGGRYSRAFLGVTGSDAVEAALKMARQYSRQSLLPGDHGRYKILSLRYSYHGVSYGAISASGQSSDLTKYGPLVPGYIQIEPPYCYRCPYGEAAYPACELACAAALERAIEAEGPETCSAFILEPVMGAAGIIDPPDAYYSLIGEICRRHGLLLVADEVTTGFGRTGKLFATSEWDPPPDILCLSKAISSGYLPLAATLATETIYRRFLGAGNQFEHGSTAAGHPVCAAVRLINIEIILREQLAERADRVGTHLRAGLEGLMREHALIGDVRGRGLMLGIELVKDRATKDPLTADECFAVAVDIANLGLITYPVRNIIGLFPPLIIDEAIADEIVSILDRALRTGAASALGRKGRLIREFVKSKLPAPEQRALA